MSSGFMELHQDFDIFLEYEVALVVVKAIADFPCHVESAFTGLGE